MSTASSQSNKAGGGTGRTVPSSKTPASSKSSGIRKPPPLKKFSDQSQLRSGKKAAAISVKSSPQPASREKIIISASQTSITRRPGGAVKKSVDTPAAATAQLDESLADKTLVSSFPDTPVLEASLNPSVLEFKPYFQELDIIIEYKLVCHYLTKEGIYVVPSLKSGRVWHGLICLHAGPFKGGVFRFNVYFQDRFPAEPPMVKFVSRIFHPQVDGTGVLNVMQAFQGWCGQRDHVWQVLLYMKKIFCSLDTWQPLNEKATIAVHESMDAYHAQAQTCVHEALLDLVDCDGSSEDDGNFLKYFNISDEALAEVKQQMGSQTTFNTLQQGGSELVLLAQRFVKSFTQHIAAARAMPVTEKAGIHVSPSAAATATATPTKASSSKAVTSTSSHASAISSSGRRSHGQTRTSAGREARSKKKSTAPASNTVSI